MATNVPPHNLGEVVDGICATIDNPAISIAELLTHIKGPDFPTGCTILGMQGIRDYAATGRGSVKVRGKAEIAEDAKGREQIIITEIPYAVNRAKLVERIAELANEKILPEISAVRDESDENTRVVVDLKRDAREEIAERVLHGQTDDDREDGRSREQRGEVDAEDFGDDPGAERDREHEREQIHEQQRHAHAHVRKEKVLEKKNTAGFDEDDESPDERREPDVSRGSPEPGRLRRGDRAEEGKEPEESERDEEVRRKIPEVAAQVLVAFARDVLEEEAVEDPRKGREAREHDDELELQEGFKAFHGNPTAHHRDLSIIRHRTRRSHPEWASLLRRSPSRVTAYAARPTRPGLRGPAYAARPRRQRSVRSRGVRRRGPRDAARGRAPRWPRP